jgi:formylglycine-generating enzyme required for sulfatase activity
MGNQDPQAALTECKKHLSDCSIDLFKDETPAHWVTLNAFLIDMYEVTNADYAQCVAAGKCKAPTNKNSNTRPSYYYNLQYAKYPVVNVSWEEADIYCKWRGARLPSEAEWEKAARGGLEGKLYSWGDTTPVCTTDVENGAQFDNCSVKDTVAVGSFKPNDYGLFDMAGNAWEWVNDWYDPSYYSSSPASNPTGPDATGNQYKVVRGGGWHSDLNNVRVADRDNLPPANRYSDFGFRCAATLP